ncbi:hypothetical protein Sango_2898300 [Sesamum angolense]|uniref:Uncharacterized protein n=1 Tax=Sesamum angolense TaxID=2727404 RepID=A0AAE1T6N2_9LAMI|nr:hypothetical protein Sango_2898300 [Sesamum angolense]
MAGAALMHMETLAEMPKLFFLDQKGGRCTTHTAQHSEIKLRAQPRTSNNFLGGANPDGISFLSVDHIATGFCNHDGACISCLLSPNVRAYILGEIQNSSTRKAKDGRLILHKKVQLDCGRNYGLPMLWELSWNLIRRDLKVWRKSNVYDDTNVSKGEGVEEMQVIRCILEEYGHLVAKRPRYASWIDVELHQCVVEYRVLSMEGVALMDTVAEIPKLSERQQSSLTRKVDDGQHILHKKVIKLRAQSRTFNALVVTIQCLANIRIHGVNRPSGLVNVPSINEDRRRASNAKQGATHANGAVSVVDSQPPRTSCPDLLGDVQPWRCLHLMYVVPKPKPRHIDDGTQIGDAVTK